MTAFADVTVIMPAYRSASTLGRALLSVANQTLKPRAVVVVDDGSPDDTFAVAQSYRERMMGIDLKVFRQANAGPGAARNRALEAAETTFVAFLDADDEWLPEKLARTMDHFRDPSVILVAHDSIEVEGETETRLDCARRFRASADAPYAGLYRRGFIDTTTVVTRLDAVRSAGGFDTTLPNAQDFELWLAVLADPRAKYVVFDDVLSRYHRQPGSVMTHVERRRLCCMRIAADYAVVLRRHPGNPLASLWFRVAAIHREAMAAHAASQAWRLALHALAALPFNMLSATWRYLTDPRLPRQARRS